MLNVARAKNYGCEVEFEIADAFNLPPARKQFTTGLAAAWWSHLRKAEISNWLAGYHRQFPPGALLVFLDNRIDLFPVAAPPSVERIPKGTCIKFERCKTAVSSRS